jgi:hypothetical protein
MRLIKPQPEQTGLQNAIDEILREMQGFTAETDEYAKMVSQLEKLYALKACEKPDRVSMDTMAIVLGNIIGVIIIVGYERTNVVTSRALNLLFRFK